MTSIRVQLDTLGWFRCKTFTQRLHCE